MAKKRINEHSIGRVEAYKCPKCDQIVVGSREKFNRHLAERGFRIPLGLIYRNRRTERMSTSRSCFGELVTFNLSIGIIVDSRKEGHHFEHSSFILGSADYVGPSYDEFGPQDYRCEGTYNFFSGYQFEQGLEFGRIALLEPTEFENLINQLKTADVNVVREDSREMNQRKELAKYFIPWDKYETENRRIAKQSYVLGISGITPEELIRTTPRLEMIVKRGKRR